MTSKPNVPAFFTPATEAKKGKAAVDGFVEKGTDGAAETIVSGFTITREMDMKIHVESRRLRKTRSAIVIEALTLYFKTTEG